MLNMRNIVNTLNFSDDVIVKIDKVLRVIAGVTTTPGVNPASHVAGGILNDAERRHSAGLMRVNHVGEVCAQALYEAQGRYAKTDTLRLQFEQAGREEEDHLAWTARRLRELGSHTSLLNPFWYAGAYVIGVVAAHLGDARSLGFVVETERQVEAHLVSHLEKLPLQDTKSRAIVEKMRDDEVVHGAAAQSLGALPAPAPVRLAMRAMASVMTATSYYL